MLFVIFYEKTLKLSPCQSCIEYSWRLCFRLQSLMKSIRLRKFDQHATFFVVERTTSFGRAIVRKQWRHGIFELEPRKWREAKIFRGWNKPSDRPGKPQPKRRKKKTKTRNTTFGQGKIVEVEDGKITNKFQTFQEM